MNKKSAIGFTIGIILIIGLAGIFFYSKNTKIINDVNKKIGSEQKQPKVIQPSIENNNVLKSCADGKSCDEGYACYNSQYSGMGPNGLVTGSQEGDLLCHKLCNSNSDCVNGKCEEVELVGGDVVSKVKFCSEK